eukprot:13027943-Alexandrium_andersonii.AAC.1
MPESTAVAESGRACARAAASDELAPALGSVVREAELTWRHVGIHRCFLTNAPSAPPWCTVVSRITTVASSGHL